MMADNTPPTPLTAAEPDAPALAPEGRKPSRPSTGTANVAVVGVSYIPTGEKKERRYAPGSHLEKCPQTALEEYLERGDVVAEGAYGDPEACARASANTAPPSEGAEDEGSTTA